MTTRRLAAILAADVVGFSSMMERDEEGTLAQIKALQRTILAPQIANHQGRLVKTTGDGFLAEFASPIEALRAAIAIQDAINLSSDWPDGPSNPVAIRIGINLGDVIIEDDGDIYGEGVNVAARLEALAPAGGILISGKVHDEVEGKVNCGFEDRGSGSVKNIARPVRTYLVQREGPAAARSIRGAALRQEIDYCRAPDGVRLAWAKVGNGPADREGGQLAQPSRIRLGEPGMARLSGAAGERQHTDPLRRSRQRPLGLGCTGRFLRRMGERP